MEGTMMGNRPWQLGNGVGRAVVEFTTNGSGVPTLTHSYGGQVTVAQATNTYTITFASGWGKTYGLAVCFDGAATIECTRTESASAGTITLAFGAAVNTKRITATLDFSHNVEG
jgi:hypothetical protein